MILVKDGFNVVFKIGKSKYVLNYFVHFEHKSTGLIILYLYSLQCVYIVQFRVYSLQCTLYSVYSLQFTVYSV